MRPGTLGHQARWGTGPGAPGWPIAARWVDSEPCGYERSSSGSWAWRWLSCGWRRSVWCWSATGRAAPSTSWSGIAAIGPILVARAAILWPPVARGGPGVRRHRVAGPCVDAAARPVARGPRDAAHRTGTPDPAALARGRLSLAARPHRDRPVRGAGHRSSPPGRSLAPPRAARHRVRASPRSWSCSPGPAFATAAIVNELALGDRPAIASRFGPTDPALEPPACTDPVVAGSTRTPGAAHGRLDRQPVHGPGGAPGDPERCGRRWTGFAATRLTLGQQGLVRLGERVWVLSPGSALDRRGRGNGARDMTSTGR